MPSPRAIVLRAPGTNCDEETEQGWRLAGADATTWHVGRLLDAPDSLDDFQILSLPGGFSYGDDLGAGRILATRLGAVLQEALVRFHDRGGLIMGICNGFQVLVRSGLLPGGLQSGPPRIPATLTHNDSGRYESRWVQLEQKPGLCPFVTDDERIELPVGHGEGKFVVADEAGLARLESAGQIVLKYTDGSGHPTRDYPDNPNGSMGAVAGICDPTGRIFGLMPHPDRHLDPLLHPRWTRRGLAAEGDGLRFFRNAVQALG